MRYIYTELINFLKSNKEYVVFSKDSARDLLKMVRYYLINEEEMEKNKNDKQR